MLYNFERLRILMQQIAPSPAEIRRRNLVVKSEDNFTQKFLNGEVKFKDDGIFVMNEGIEFRRFIFMKSYRVRDYGLPKYHLICCSKVREIGRGYYVSASSSTVDVLERFPPIEVHRDVSLDLCEYCRQEIVSDEIPTTTREFHKMLIHETELEAEKRETDIFGYTFDWHKVSESYRISKNYSCEKCGIEIGDPLDRRFIHVHHKNGNKKWNNPDNLECLCVLCHSFVNAQHEQNFRKPRMKTELNTFMKLYKQQLQNLGNQYLDRL